MDLKRPLVVLAAVGALAAPLSACGANTDVNRNEQECGAAEAGGSEQELCEETETDNEQETDEEDDGVS